ncbi:MAG TPA: patatin-like phospholipase family protein [Kofleriaceae bacterium]|jgi:NTE family protein
MFRAGSLGHWLAERPFGLAMSSGFFSFFAHAGMLAALTSRGLAPRLVSGSSAGALVGGAWAAGVAPDAIATRLETLERRDFWDPAPGPGLLAGRRFDAILRQLLPIHVIEDCPVPVRISVFDIRARHTEVLARGDLADAIRASCAVPGLFHPVRIGGRMYWDGGILDRPGLDGLAGEDRVLYHHIAARSPWRAPGSKSLRIPRRRGLAALVLDDLPRSGPFRLSAGRRALALARTATMRALDAPLPVDGVVRIHATDSRTY